MTYIKRNAKQEKNSFKVPIYPRSKTLEELGKIYLLDDVYEQVVVPSISNENEQNVTFPIYGNELSFDKAKAKIESFMVI